MILVGLFFTCDDPGADPGEVKWVNFHPAFFLSPLLFFPIPQILIGFVTLLQKFTPPPISKSWIRACDLVVVDLTSKCIVPSSRKQGNEIIGEGMIKSYSDIKWNDLT